MTSVSRIWKGGSEMAEKIVNRLVTIKSIVTLVLTAVFAYLSIIGTISGDNFLSVFLIVIGFYFGTQKVKEQEKNA